MANLNLKAAFLPTLRADAGDYWLGLGVIALIDAVRLSMSGGAGLLPWLLILFFMVSLHINRLRDAGRSANLVLIPVFAGVAAKMLVGLVAMFFAYMPIFTEFLISQGIDPNDPVAMQQTAFDPAIAAAHEAYLRNNPEIAFDTMRAGAWPSTWAFWLTVGLIGRWFARMPRAL
jgi:uncharacterized membrane protein YhaH (DUF805 family)